MDEKKKRGMGQTFRRGGIVWWRDLRGKSLRSYLKGMFGKGKKETGSQHAGVRIRKESCVILSGKRGYSKHGVIDESV